MTDLFHRVRLLADVHVLDVPSSPDWSGIQTGFRSDFEVADVRHFSIVVDCNGTIAPGHSGIAKLEVILLRSGEVAQGARFHLRHGPLTAAEGVVTSIESSEVMTQ